VYKFVRCFHFNSPSPRNRRLLFPIAHATNHTVQLILRAASRLAQPLTDRFLGCTIFLMLTRRAFLGLSALLATELFGASADSKSSPASPSRDLEKLADSALREAKRLKASYCDIRINRYHNQDIALRMSPERGTGK